MLVELVDLAPILLESVEGFVATLEVVTGVTVLFCVTDVLETLVEGVVATPVLVPITPYPTGVVIVVVVLFTVFPAKEFATFSLKLLLLDF